MLHEIKQFCRAKELSFNRFGLLAAGDGGLVSSIMCGRSIGDELAERVRAFMNDNAEATFDYATMRAADGSPRVNYANLAPYLGNDDWQVNIASGTVALYNAIARAHPERITA